MAKKLYLILRFPIPMTTCAIMFLSLTPKGLVLSPAYEFINPSIINDGLALDINMDSNALELVIGEKRRGGTFRLEKKQMDSH